MKNTNFFIVLFVCLSFWASAKDNQVGDLASQNFDAIVSGTTANIATNGDVTFTGGKWTNDETIGSGTNSTWNKFYSYQVSISKDATGGNTSNYLNSVSGGERLSLLFSPQAAGTIILEARVKTPATTGNSGFISLDNDPGATSATATGRANLIYVNTSAAGTSTISYGNTTQVLVSGLTPATWYNIKVVYYITGVNAGKWNMYYGTTDVSTLITPTPIAYSSTTSAYALQRLYIAAPLSIDDIRIYQGPIPPTATVSLSVEGGTAMIGKNITGSYTYNSTVSTPELGTTWALLRANDAAFATKKDTLDWGIVNDAITFSLSPYTISSADVYKYIRLEVTPKDNKGNVGYIAASSLIGPVLDSKGGNLKTMMVDNENGAPQYTTGGTPGGWGTLTTGQLVGLTQTRAYKGGVAGDVYGDFATYKPNLTAGAGYYRVQVVSVVSGSPFTVDIHHATASAAGQYTDEAPIKITPGSSASQWEDLGYYYFSADGTETVKLSAISTSSSLRTDAVSFTKLVATASDNRLLSVTTDVGTLTQTANKQLGFDFDVTDYSLVLPTGTTSYTVKALVASDNSTIRVNSTLVSNNTFSAAINSTNNASIEVTNNGVTKTYNLKIVTPAQLVANNLILFEPIRDEASSFSVIPPIDANFTATITATSPAGIIKADGTVIFRPTTTTSVDVTVQVKSKTNAADIATTTLQVRVTPTYVAPSGDLAVAQAAFSRKKQGLFVHYVPYLSAGKNGTINDINVLADNFDAVQLAQDAADFGVEFVVFTAWHVRDMPLFPSKVSKRWRDDRRATVQMQSYSNRDLIGDLITALKAKNIDLHLYIHPTNGYDNKDNGPNDNLLQDQSLTGYTGFTDGSKNYTYWNQYINELHNELCERYGNGLKGFWIDGGVPNIDIPRLRKTLRSYNPEAIIVENAGGNRDAVIPTRIADYTSWETSNVSVGSLSLVAANPNIVLADGKTWPGHLSQVALVVGNGWWAKAGTNTSQYAAKDLYLYNILLASTSKSGGLLYSTGCYAGKATDFANGNIWDGTGSNGNIYATLKAVNDYIKPVEESIKNTNVGKAYPSNSTAPSWLDQYQWGVSTESTDGKYVYLHVVKPPVGKTLSIGVPADNSIFSTNAIVLKSKQAVGFEKTATGYDITLPATESWDAINTVIRLERSTTALLNAANDEIISIKVLEGKLLVTSNSAQQLDIFGIDGTKVMSYRLVAGEYTVFLNRKGLFIIRLQRRSGVMSKILIVE
jgi:alpha-L-fucosidase